MEVRLDPVGGGPVADHQGEGEDPTHAVPDRCVWGVDELLDAAQEAANAAPG
ncbi:hypothetical protein [Streptomyces sp. NPDC048637]|uniref:hypothetical protein n=1 Tax=Streptomyces sp. NPDC048637 TaxID=3155636 RepID=UPI0034446110